MGDHPTDWRNPVVINIYNEIMKAEVFGASPIRYIDVWHIVLPMWDSAPDYCHYYNKVGLAMAHHVINTILL